MTIGELIQKLREEKRWTLDELVKYSGVCRSTLQRMEYHNLSNVTVSTIKKLAEALDTSPLEIFMALVTPPAKGKPDARRARPRSRSL